MNWVDVESKKKKINWVGIDGSLQKTMNWTTLCNETNSENNHKLGDKFEKFVTGYLNQLDAENRPT